MPMLHVLGSTFKLSDPRPYIIGFPLESELPEKSIVASRGMYALLLDKIPFETKYTIKDDDILNLIDIMDEGYTVYTLKNPSIKEPKLFRNWEAEHGLILKSFSSDFCKMERLTIDVNPDTKSDDVCYTWNGIVYHKLE